MSTLRSPRMAFILPLAAFLVFVGFAAAALFATLRGERDIAQLPSAMLGKPAPVTQLADLQSPAATVSVAQFAGAPLLVNFYASWCAPCRAEAPALALLAKDITILGIAYKDNPADTTRFLDDYGNPFIATGIDRDGTAGISWGLYGVPETYLLDSEGIIRLRHAGPIDRRVLNEIIMPAIWEMSVIGEQPAIGEKK